MKITKILTTLLIVFFCVVAVYGAKSLTPSNKPATLDKRLLLRSKGDPGGRLWIVEYVDFQCKSCQAASAILESYLNKYPSQIYLQTRFHPMKSHPYAVKSAIYAECAAKQGKFWEFHDLLFQRQHEWSKMPGVDEAFRGYAELAGINLKKLDACVNSPETEKIILKEKEDAAALGVLSTPTFFINGKMAVGPKGLVDELEAYFKEELT